MREFLKCLFDGILATIVVILLAVIIWAFLTLMAVVAIGLAPVWVIVFFRMAAKMNSFKDVASKTLDELERILDNAK